MPGLPGPFALRVVKVLLDSVILIDHLNGIPDATAYLARSHLDCAISAITRAELLARYDGAAAAPIKKLLDAFPVLTLDAPAQIHQLKLATRNTKDFPPATYDFAFVPYEI
jgi:predicted nucleic acid-binding protein